MADSKAAAIAGLVAALKAGQLSKEELFLRLQELQKTGAGAPSETPSGSPGDAEARAHTHTHSDPHTHTYAHTPAMSPHQQGYGPVEDDGHMNGSADASPISLPSSEGAPARPDPSALHRSYMAFRAAAHTHTHTHTQAQAQAHTGAHNGSGGTRGGVHGHGPVGQHAAGHGQAEHGSRRPSTASASAGSRSRAGDATLAGRPRTATHRGTDGYAHTPLPTGVDTQSQLLSHEERELAECTFQPVTTTLPRSYGATATRVLSSVPFSARSDAWSRHRDEQRARRAADAAARELEGCTFKPAINQSSKVVSALRELATPGMHRSGGSVHDRLFSQSRSRGRDSSRSDPRARSLSGSHSVGASAARPATAGGARGFSDFEYDMSTRPGSASGLRGAVARHHLEGGRPLFTSPATGSPRHGNYALVVDESTGHRPLTRAEEEELAECTFQPRINRSRDAYPVQSRYRAASAGTARRKSSVLPSGLEHCTFRPQTNDVRPDVMPNIASYVSESVFERLPSRRTRAQAARESAVRAEKLQETGMSRSPASRAELHVDQNLSMLSGAPPTSGRRNRSIGSSESAEERRRRMEEFLARQAAADARKRMHIEQLSQQLAPPLQPALCTKSLEIAESMRGDESFLERVVRETARKEHETLKTKARLSRDPECTFAPAINPASKNLPRRSANELSKGDALKRETQHRMLRLRREQEELDGITFAPTINPRSRQVQGRLRLLDDPDTFLTRVAQEAALAEERARREARAHLESELRECSFKPEVHDAPEYVKRIARSMAIARAVRPLGPDGAGGAKRPDWR